MSLFEFLMVLVSIIVGLGIAEVLTGIARRIRYRQSATGYWLHSVLVALIFFALLQQWWEAWNLRAVETWEFHALLLMLAGPVGLYLIAHLLFPERVDGQDFRDYYERHLQPIWWLAAVTVLLATVFRPVVFDRSLLSVDNATSLLFLAGFVTLGLVRRRRLHEVLVPIFLALLLLDIVRWNPAIAA